MEEDKENTTDDKGLPDQVSELHQSENAVNDTEQTLNKNAHTIKEEKLMIGATNRKRAYDVFDDFEEESFSPIKLRKFTRLKTNDWIDAIKMNKTSEETEDGRSENNKHTLNIDRNTKMEHMNEKTANSENGGIAIEEKSSLADDQETGAQKNTNTCDKSDTDICSSSENGQAEKELDGNHSVCLTSNENGEDKKAEEELEDCGHVRSSTETKEVKGADKALNGCRRVVYIHSQQLIDHCNRLPRIPDRAGMVHSLIESLGLLKFMQVVAPRAAEEEEVMKFHSRDYIEFLQSISHLDDEEKIDSQDAEQYGMTYDCPVQEGVYECAALVAGATVTAAQALCDGQCQVAINWCGGWHHAQRSEASGFCYINDIVLGILTLRNQFSRVLYVDLDLHHGDGVENAFSTTSRVMTVSFHKHAAGFFPGSGGIDDVGSRGGKYFSVNVPMKDGLCDNEFFAVFKRVMSCVRETYDPDVVVCQCGADGLAGDPMSSFNLTLTSLRHCLYLLMTWKLPLLLLGGGGYHHANTARCWASLTALTVGRKLPQDVPDHKYFTEYGPDYELTVEAGNRKDDNTVKDLANTCTVITENLQKIKGKAV